MDTLVSMNVFRYVVEVGSFVGAAERMQMSAAMASKHVMHLEQQLARGCCIARRRRVAPTEAGREYHERLVQALSELDEAGQAVGAASVVPQGRLRVTSLSAFGLRHVMQAVTDYAGRFPDVTVDMTLSDRVVDLIEEGYDVAVRAAPNGLKSSSLVARQIATAHILLVASPEYLEKHGTPATIGDLAHHYLRRDSNSTMLDSLVIDAAAASRVNLNGNLIVNHLEGLRACSRARASRCSAPRWSATTSSPAGSCRCCSMRCRRTRRRSTRSTRAVVTCPRRCVRSSTSWRRVSKGSRCARRSNRACACCRSRG